jgi:hypothetical protein
VSQVIHVVKIPWLIGLLNILFAGRTPAILAIQKAEIRRIMLEVSPGK